jgi:hypothetical protein
VTHAEKREKKGRMRRKRKRKRKEGKKRKEHVMSMWHCHISAT